MHGASDDAHVSDGKHVRVIMMMFMTVMLMVMMIASSKVKSARMTATRILIVMKAKAIGMIIGMVRICLLWRW